jgi:hypothetical protein
MGLDYPTDKIEKGALTGPIWADKTHNLTLAEGEANIVDSHHPAKMPAYILHFKERHIPLFPLWLIPFGAYITIYTVSISMTG